MLQGYAIMTPNKVVAELACGRLEVDGNHSIECVGGPLDGDRVNMRAILSEKNGAVLTFWRQKATGVYDYALWMEPGSPALGARALLVYRSL